jgi:hypothetical protein
VCVVSLADLAPSINNPVMTLVHMVGSIWPVSCSLLVPASQPKSVDPSGEEWCLDCNLLVRVAKYAPPPNEEFGKEFQRGTENCCLLWPKNSTTKMRICMVGIAVVSNSDS